VGDEILKTLLKCFIILFVASISAFSKETLSLGNEVKAYDQIFFKIGEKRIGVDSKLIEGTANPFIVSRGDSLGDGNVTEAKIVYELEAIFDKKAKINGVWYHQKDTVGDFKLVKVNRNFVVLQNELEKNELYITDKR
jgi:hypothetical protein